MRSDSFPAWKEALAIAAILVARSSEGLRLSFAKVSHLPFLPSFLPSSFPPHAHERLRSSANDAFHSFSKATYCHQQSSQCLTILRFPRLLLASICNFRYPRADLHPASSCRWQIARGTRGRQGRTACVGLARGAS